MPQVQKPEVRARILDAALAVLAERGLDAASMAEIAERAGVGTASIYRYYASKDDLYGAAIPTALVHRFEALLDRRVRALAHNALRGESLDDAGDEMLQFWLANRLAVVVLLRERGDRFVDLLSRHTVAELRAAHPRVAISARTRFVLAQIFDNTRRLLAATLARYPEPQDLREAIAAFWTYQIAGLRALGAHLVAAARAR